LGGQVIDGGLAFALAVYDRDLTYSLGQGRGGLFSNAGLL